MYIVMKIITKALIILLFYTPFVTVCQAQNKEKVGSPKSIENPVIADYSVAKNSVLRRIPKEYIDKARNSLHIAYQHSSHGTHVTKGLFGLPDFIKGDELLFGITNNSPEPGKLDFRDLAMQDYADEGKDATDLSRDETAFINTTRNFLDDPKNAEINVVMWSWCSISRHKVAANYLPGMDSLIAEYGAGGSKIGKGEGKRHIPVTFVFMTGHASPDSNVGEGRPKNQSDLIIDYCSKNKQYCLDYYSIDTHDMMGNYWEDTGDDGNSLTYKGNFYLDWQNAHKKGTDWYENRPSPGGVAECGAHNSQHITANRKAFAMWWILARIAGWDGQFKINQ